MMRRVVLAAWIATVCAPIAGCAPADSAPPSEQTQTLVIFHNNTGPMCIEALAWLSGLREANPAVVVEEHLTTEPAGVLLLNQLSSQFSASAGLSSSFGYLPIIFCEGQAFSGFNAEIQSALEELLSPPVPG